MTLNGDRSSTTLNNTNITTGPIMMGNIISPNYVVCDLLNKVRTCPRVRKADDLYPLNLGMHQVNNTSRIDEDSLYPKVVHIQFQH